MKHRHTRLQDRVPIAAEHVAQSGQRPRDQSATLEEPDRAPQRSIWGQEWLISALVIGCGGFAGANVRYAVGQLVAARWGTSFPWGTLLINVSGSFVLGLFVTLVMERLSAAPALRAFVAAGFLGAFTTFSTFSYETVQLFLAGSPMPALAYVAGSLILGLGAAAAGVVCAQAT